jgi:hypothetical protein
MSVGNEIHLDDIGTIFRILATDCGTVVDISSATSLQICFTAPSSPFTKVATTTGVGTDGLFEYKAVVGDIFEIGAWQWQGVIVFPNGDVFHTNVREFEVFDNIC